MQEKLLTILILLWVSVTYGSSQTTYRHTHYDDHNGMSQWHLTKVLQDGSGFMWFATWNGLNRFDGYDFAVFKSKPGDGNNLTSDRIRNMVLGDDGNIYCVNNNIVWRFNLRTYTFQSVDAQTQERYLARMNYDTSVFKEPTILEYGSLSFDGIRQHLLDSQKNHWLMGRYGVEKLSPTPRLAKTLDCIPQSIVRAIYRDNKKRIWIGTRDAEMVVVLDSLANLMGYLGADGRLHREMVKIAATYSVFQQKNGTIWLGTKPNGMYRLTEKLDGTFEMHHFVMGTPLEIKAGKTLNSNDIYDFKEDRKGRLWVATQGGGLCIVDNPQSDTPLFHSLQSDLKNYPKDNLFMRRLLFVGDSIVLASTTEGLVVAADIYAPAPKVSFNLHQRESKRAESLSCSALMDFLLDRKGRLFISTESAGINLLQTKDLRAKQFDFIHYNTDNGMGTDVTLAMTEIGDEILIQCNNQVTRLNADLNHMENFNDQFFSIASRFSDAEPVLLSNGNWLLSLENGILVVPEQLFHQRQYVPRLVITSFAVPGRPVDYSAENLDTIVLGPSERDISITYAAIDYTNNQNIKYVTRITESKSFWQFGKSSRPDDEEWSVPNDSRTTSLYNLAPGTYKLDIRSTNAEGLWVKNTRTVYIVVEPMFWETGFAYLLYTLFFILLVSGITYTFVYIRTLKQQREENLQAYLKVLETPVAIQRTQARSEETAASSVSHHDVDDVESDEETTVVARDTAPLVASPIINEEDDAFMRRLLQFVDENIGNSDVGVDEMASATATSRSSLNRKMKQLLGVTPADFLKEARMKRAQQLLLTTARGVTEIAYNCGFSDPKYFSKCFKAVAGMSPSDFRQNHQASSSADQPV